MLHLNNVCCLPSKTISMVKSLSAKTTSFRACGSIVSIPLLSSSSHVWRFLSNRNIRISIYCRGVVNSDSNKWASAFVVEALLTIYLLCFISLFSVNSALLRFIYYFRCFHLFFPCSRILARVRGRIMPLLWQIGRACAYTPTALKMALRVEKGLGEVHSLYTRLKNTLPACGC